MARKIRLYVDEHVSKSIVRGLRRRGVDVQTVHEAGLLAGADEKHLAHAAAEGRVLFTQDDDFLKLHRAGAIHAGIVYALQGTSIGKIIHGLMLICLVLDAEEIEGRVEFIH